MPYEVAAYDYNVANNPYQAPSTSVGQSRTDYDALGRPVRAESPYRTPDPNAPLTQSSYDEMGRLTQVAQPDGS